MCGIAGFVLNERRTPSPEETAALKAGIRALSHRGPDGIKTWTGPGAGLGHARLAVIDLAAAADQPMESADGRVRIIFNGEIYNFLELRRELEAQGALFRTDHSDTETVLMGYLAWGPGVVERLRGMFAFAIHDDRLGRLLLVRDRLGKKPLYYAERPGGDLVFASEIKGLLPWPGLERRANLDAINDYLTFQYVPGPATAFQGVRRLMPGELLLKEFRAPAKLSTYYRIPPQAEPGASKPRRPGDLEAELIERLAEAVRIRLVSDVPLGAFLSGGVDSSAVVAMMAKASSRPVRTFTIGFGAKSHDERPYAAEVARRYRTDHTELVLEPDVAALVPRLVHHFGEPFADSSALPSFAVSELTRRHVTVALTGDGGDEAFLGYERYRWLQRLEGLARALPPPMLTFGATVLRRTPDRWRRLTLLRRLSRLADAWGPTPLSRYQAFVTIFSEGEKSRLYDAALAPLLAHRSIDRLAPYFEGAADPVAAAAAADRATYLPDDLNVKVDVASMAFGLECRAPFLDHELIAFAQAIPIAEKLRGGPKGLLKRALEPHLPHDVLYRPKQGFAVPIAGWLRSDLKPLLMDTLSARAARERGLLKPAAVEALVGEHMAGIDHSARLWSLLMLELWFRAWIDGATGAQPAVRAGADAA